MEQEIYIHIGSKGYVIGGYVSKVHASRKMLEYGQEETKMVKLKITDENILTFDEAVETIKKHNEEMK